MPVYSCGFNEFSQVSSATDDQKRGCVSLPMVIDWQSKIGMHARLFRSLFTVRRHSLLCKCPVLAMANVSVCLSVRLSHR